MEGIRHVFISLPLFIASLIPILICLGYAFLSVRIIVTANKEKDIAKLNIGQRSLVKALVALTIMLLVCCFIYN